MLPLPLVDFVSNAGHFLQGILQLGEACKQVKQATLGLSILVGLAVSSKYLTLECPLHKSSHASSYASTLAVLRAEQLTCASTTPEWPCTLAGPAVSLRQRLAVSVRDKEVEWDMISQHCMH